MKHFLLVSVIALFLSVICGSSYAQVFGPFDSTFGTNAKLYTNTYAFPSGANKFFTKYNSRTWDTLSLTRYLENGTVDNTFGTNGTAISTNEPGVNVAACKNIIELPNGGFIRYGTTNYVTGGNDGNIAKLNQNLAVDHSFGNNGQLIFDHHYINEYIDNILVLSTGKLLVVEKTKSGGLISPQDTINFIRITANGKIDSTYGTYGLVSFTFDSAVQYYNLKLDNQDNFTCAAITKHSNQYVLESFKVQSNGAINTSYGQNGFQYAPSFFVRNPASIACIIYTYADEIITTSDYPYSHASILCKYKTDGTIDSSFGVNGLDTLRDPSWQGSVVSYSCLIPTIDNKILAFGRGGYQYWNNYGMVFTRLNTNGSIDTSFGVNGYAFTAVNASSIYASEFFLLNSKIYGRGSWSNSTGSYAAIWKLNNGPATLSKVWPGDANADGVVDNADLLNIGLGYGVVGYKRASASINWAAQASAEWYKTFMAGANYKNADCNGDSIIDSNDTLAIIQNYSLTHQKAVAATANSGAPLLKVKLRNSSATGGDTLLLDVLLGDSTLPATVYGLAFSVDIDTSIAMSNSIFSDFANCWMGKADSNLLCLSKIGSGIDIGLTRINQQNKAGNGIIATIRLVLKNLINGTYPVVISGIKAIDKLGNNVSLDLGDADTLNVVTTGIEAVASTEAKLTLAPNPSNDKITLKSEQPITAIVIYDSNGTMVFSKGNVDETIVNIDVRQFSAGIYTVKTLLNSSTVVRQFIVTEH